MGKITKFEEVEIAKIKPYENNAKIHTEAQIEKLCQSIDEFGFLSPCLIDSEYNLIAGHGRVMAAQMIGWQTVPCVFAEGLTEAQRKAYILADNKLSEMAEWDKDLVSMELEGLKNIGFDIDVTGFDIDDIIFTDDMEPEMTEEEFEDWVGNAGEPRIDRGQVWQLGDHRLMCGDSTSADDVQTLVGGVEVDCLITDPPYNVDYGSKAEAINEYGYDFSDRHIENDCMPAEQFAEFLEAAFQNAYDVMRPGAPFYIWHASITVYEFERALKTVGLQTRQQLIWVKNAMVLGRQDYQWKHEPCLYGWKEGAGHYFIDYRTLLSTMEEPLEGKTKDELIQKIKDIYSASDTLYENKPVKSELHPTMKPVPLIKKLIRNSTKQGDTVLDLFGGSGTTLIAAEEMERKCLMMEYDPKFAEVIIERWEQQTGQEAVKIYG